MNAVHDPSPAAAARPGLPRRRFLAAAATAVSGAALLPGTTTAASAARRSSAPPLIDVNVHLGRWPLRRVPGDASPEALAEHLRSRGVTEAWVGSFDGLLHKDLAAVNTRLADDCQRAGRQGFLRPFGSVNPAAPGWEEDVQRCAHDHRMPGIRLHPNYHGYALDLPAFAALLRQATELGLVVQLAVAMEDERMMHSRLRVPPVDTAPLPDLLRQITGLRLVLLNALGAVQPVLLRRLIDGGSVFVDIATQEGVGGVARLLGQVPVERVLFGSHAPLFYWESAAFKLRESVLPAPTLAAIQSANARRLVEPGK